MPAIHTKAAAPAKMSTTIGKAREANMSSRPYRQPVEMSSSSLCPPEASQQGLYYAVCSRVQVNQPTHDLMIPMFGAPQTAASVGDPAYLKRPLYVAHP